MKVERYIQRQDDEWFKVTWPHRISCCDCGLVHDFKVRRNRKTGQYEMSARRVPSATGGKRRSLKSKGKGVFAP